MKQESKQKISHLELVRKRMFDKKWKAADLARATGVQPGVLSRYLHDDGINADNLFSVLLALDLISCENQASAWDEKYINDMIVKIENSINEIKEKLAHPRRRVAIP